MMAQLPSDDDIKAISSDGDAIDAINETHHERSAFSRGRHAAASRAARR